MNTKLNEVKEFCELQTRRAVQDEFDNGINWMANIVLDILNEQDLAEVHQMIYEEQ